jgi:hypothetical protein
MASKEKIAFLKTHLEVLSPNVLRQFKRDIVAQKRRKAVAGTSTKTQETGEEPSSAAEEHPVSPDVPKPPLASVKPPSWIHPALVAIVRSCVRDSVSTGKGENLQGRTACE